MPIYEYQCDSCGVFECSQRITEDALKKCPTCKGKVRRLISNTSFMLKGSGWYATDYGHSKSSSNSDQSATNGKTGSESSSSSSSTEKSSGSSDKSSGSSDKTSSSDKGSASSSGGDKAASSS
jgi:putative FmdB family regulatory protein